MNSRVVVKAKSGDVLLDVDVYCFVLQMLLSGKIQLGVDFDVFVDGVKQSAPPSDDEED